MKVCILVSGEKNGVFGRRVRKQCQHAPLLKDATIFYRDDKHKLLDLFLFMRELIKLRPELVYIESVSFSCCIAAIATMPILRFKYIVSTGDSYGQIVKQFYGFILGCLAGLLEHIAYAAADIIITRSPDQKDFLTLKGYRNAFFLNEGVNIDNFKPFEVNDLKQKLGIANFLTIGVIGSIVWDKRNNFCYGWEIIQVVNMLKEKPVKGLIVGGGNGLEKLKKIAQSYGLSDRIIFTGKIAHEQIPSYINCMDVCFSTQSNNMAGEMRIPTKLEEYLACGKFVISTDVGYAKTVLRDAGFLIPYKGVRDDSYPAKAAKVIEAILSDRSILERGKLGINIAKDKFSFEKLSLQLEEIIYNNL